MSTVVPAAAPAEPPPAPPVEPTGTEAFHLGDEQPLPVLVARWLQLPASAREHGRIILGENNTRGRLVLVQTTAARATELGEAAALPTSPLAAVPEAVVTLAEFQATRSVNVHERPSAHVGALPRTIPHGGYGVMLLGAVAGGTSSTEGEHPWVYVVVAEEDPGWASGHFLGPVGACPRPGLEPFLAALPAADRAAAARDAVVGRATLRRAGADVEAIYFVARLRETTRSHVAFFESRECAVGEPIVVRSFDGEVNDFELPRAEREGDSLLLVGATPNDPPGLTYWTLMAFDATEPAWSAELMSDSVLEREERTLVTVPYDEGGTYAPIEIEEPGGRHVVVRWNGGEPSEDAID